MPVTSPIKVVIPLKTSLFQLLRKMMLAISTAERHAVMPRANFTV
jgi:hypothetical protein